MSCCSACGKHACACGCGAIAGTPLPLANRPGLAALDYRVGRYADFRATMQAGLSDAALPALAGLRTREAEDPAMALLDAWAVGADVLSFYTERIANEGYLRTATERRSVLELARLVDYRLRPGVAASVYLAYTVEKDSPPVTIPAGARVQSVPAPGEQMQTFETAEPLDARHEWNALKPRLTRPQDITLDNVATLDALWVAGTATGLKPNDRLLFVFGELPDGVAAIRQVQSVEVQQPSGRSRVRLQPLGVPRAAIVAAARAALAAWATDGTSLRGNVERLYRGLLLGGGDVASINHLLGGFGLEVPALAGGPPAAQQFLLAVAGAFEGNGAATPAPAGGFGALFGALTLAPTVQPANSLRLRRSIASALGKASDARPQLLLKFAPQLRDTFYRAWASVPQGEPSPALSGVYALRVAAPRFGYNAVWPTRLELDDGVYQTTPADDWPLDHSESADTLYLDNAYDAIRPGGYVVVQTPATNTAATVVEVRKLDAVAVHPRTAYGISGKTTELGLVPMPDEPAAAVAMAVVVPRITNSVRIQQVFAQSEPLALAELVIDEEVGTLADGGNATRLTLDVAVDGLKAGRWVIVEGQRSDVPGTDAVRAAELVMLSAVEQGVDANLPGDTVHSTLVFANAGLAYRYRRDTVSIHANVVRATHGESRREVLGSGSGAASMQAFVLKQPPLT